MAGHGGSLVVGGGYWERRLREDTESGDSYSRLKKRIRKVLGKDTRK